ncbi:hypothetical protein GCM10010532_096620 [Dactylosporangium siamense]
MHPRRRHRTRLTNGLTATDPTRDDQLGTSVQDLVDLDAVQMGKQLSDGIAHSGNNSWSDIHHTVRAGAQ